MTITSEHLAARLINYPKESEVKKLVELIDRRGESRDYSCSRLAHETFVITARIIADNPDSGDTPEEQYAWFCNKAWSIDGKPLDKGPDWGEYLVQTNEKTHQYARIHLQRNPLTLPKYPSTSSVQELKERIVKRGASRDSTVSLIDEKTLLETAQIVARHPETGTTPLDQYNWLCELAWKVDGKPEDRGPYWGEHLLQNSCEVHDYAVRFLRPGLTRCDDTDDIVREFLGEKSHVVESANRLLNQLERRDGMDTILYDLTGNTPSHTKAQKISNVLSLLNEVDLRSAVKGPLSERPSIEEVAETLRQFHQAALDHGRIQLFEALPADLREAHFSKLPAEGTPHEKAEYIKTQFESLPADVFNDVTKVNLIRKYLRVLPPEIGELTSLRTLSLYNNKLASLPAEFGNLRSLTVLRIMTNKLASLPAEFGKLRSLTVLWLAGNRLTSLPPEIGDLGNLKALTIHINRLTSLPPEFGKLRSLEKLTMYANKITSLPSALRPLKKRLRLGDLPFEEPDPAE